MKKLILVFLMTSVQVFSQNYRITYKSFFEGKEIQDPVLVYTSEVETWIATEKIIKNQKEFPFEVQKINRTTSEIAQFGFLKEQKVLNM